MRPLTMAAVKNPRERRLHQSGLHDRNEARKSDLIRNATAAKLLRFEGVRYGFPSFQGPGFMAYLPFRITMGHGPDF